MISVENDIGVPTSLAAASMRCRMLPFPWEPRCRKMFSTMMTVESTTMPKSTAPREMRLALVPVPTRPQKAQSSASGMLRAVMSAARQLPRKRSSVSDTRTMPDEEVLQHGVDGDLHEVAAVVVGLDLHPRRQHLGRLDVLDPLVDALQGRGRLAAVAHEHDALHDVVVVVLADHAEAGGVADVDGGDVADADGDALLLDDDDILDVVDRVAEGHAAAEEADAADVERLLAHGEALAADVGVGVGDGGGELLEGDRVAAEAERVDVDLVLLGDAAVAGHVDDAGDLLPLAFHDPVLGLLQLAEGVALALQRVAVHLSDGVPRRESTPGCRWGAGRTGAG